MKFFNSIGPNPRVARMFMAEKGLKIASEDVNLMAGENRRRSAPPPRKRRKAAW
jgi:hypothetical protein